MSTRSICLLIVFAGFSVSAPSALAAGPPAKDDDPKVSFVLVDKARRLEYLANATIWSDPGPLTPRALSAGPPLHDGSGVERALDGKPFPCTFAEAGKTLGGNSRKFSCTTSAGKKIRVKFTEPTKEGNREVFATVAASRLMWALGFAVHPVYPVALQCLDCPEDPHSGEGPKATRSYLAIYEPRWTDPALVDHPDRDEGWRWAELDAAIDTLSGEVETRQRQYFDALTLAAVLLQHGDRKPEQQRLSCMGPLNANAGTIRQIDGDPVFVETPGATACASPAVLVQDLGATFGGAGQASKGSTAKMNLHEWVDKPVFQKSEPGAACHGVLTVSMAAGEGSLPNPRIGEAGRQFLLERLRRLTDAHLRAIFSAARVNLLPQDDAQGAGVDAWVAAFKEKVRQIEAHTCAP